MLLLLPGNPHARFNKELPPELVGWLITAKRPFTGKEVDRLQVYPWALDNQCFTQGENFNFDNYMTFLERAKRWPGRCLFATVPDVVGNATATHERWKEYAARMRKLDIPLAYVAQDGLTKLPRVKFDCLFIGGTTEYKLSQTAAKLIADARRKGKWVHMGRVNTAVRIRHAYTLNVDSIDGTAWARAPQKNITWTLPLLRALHGQAQMFAVA